MSKTPLIDKGDKVRANEKKPAVGNDDRFNRKLFETLPIGLAICDIEGSLTYVNQAYASIIGYTVDEVLKLTYWEITPKEYEQQEQEQLISLKKTGCYGPYEKDYIHKDGHHVPVRLSGVLMNEEGQDFIWSSVENITERKELEKALLEQQNILEKTVEDRTQKYLESKNVLRKLSRAVEQSPVSIIITGTDGTIEYVNPKFETTTGYSAEEAIGKNPRILKSGEMSPEEYKNLWKTIMGGNEWRGEFHNKHKDGTLYWELASISPIKAADGTITSFLAVKEDITERKEAEKAILEAKDEADKANKAKSEFLANMSHDLRTPLNAIIGFSQMMEGKAFGPLGNPHYEEYAKDIHKSGDLLVNLIDDILDLSKIEAGKYEMDEEALDVTSFIRSSATMIEPNAQKMGVTINVDLPSDLPMLNGSRRALVQILNNLLSNAVKFTPADGKVSVSAKIDETGSMLISVADTGIGIPDEKIAKVLNPFEQADSAHAKLHEGTGLGLHLCQNLIKLHGGDLKLQSKVGKGTMVTVKFPPERTVVRRDGC